MKKIRIWLNSLNLVQQFIGVAFLTVAFFIIFFSGVIDKQIDKFVNNQMYSTIHEAQSEYISYYNLNNIPVGSGVTHYIYSENHNAYIGQIEEKDKDVIIRIDAKKSAHDGYIVLDNSIYNYSTRDYGNNKLVSFIDPVVRSNYKKSLTETVVNSSVMIIAGLFIFFLIWIASLITPLNQIKSHIEKLKNGEETELNISRHDEIGEVAEAIVNMNEELEKQNRIKEEMIQNISHDLKTPIATIKSYSESIKDGIYPYGTLEKSVDVISEHADRLEKKVYSLITFNKIGYLQDVDESKKVLMSDIINKSIMSCEVLRNDIEIIKNIDENIYFHGEEEPWRVVVENLLDNALRYAKEKVYINLNNDLLEVINDGEPIEKDRLDKLFKPYEKGTKGKFGLGLSIVKKVTETYGYNVTGENNDVGVVFRVWRVVMPKKSSKKETKLV